MANVTVEQLNTALSSLVSSFNKKLLTFSQRVFVTDSIRNQITYNTVMMYPTSIFKTHGVSADSGELTDVEASPAQIMASGLVSVVNRKKQLLGMGIPVKSNDENTFIIFTKLLSDDKNLDKLFPTSSEDPLESPAGYELTPKGKRPGPRPPQPEPEPDQDDGCGCGEEELTEEEAENIANEVINEYGEE
jgi:hypothetical protein